MLFRSGQFDDALTYFQQAVQLMEKLKAAPELPGALCNLADASSRLGQYDQALTNYLRALELARNGGDKYAAAVASNGMAAVFEYQGRYGAALNAREDALKAFRELNDRTTWMVETLNGYGHTLSLLGRSADAGKILGEALALANEIKNDADIAQALNFQGESLFYDGDLKRAKTLFDKALQTATRSKDRGALLAVKINLGRWALAQGRAREIVPEFKSLAGEADAQGLKYWTAECFIYRTQGLISTSDYRAAQDEVDAVRRTAEKLGLKFTAAQAHYLQAEIFQNSGKTAEAASQYQQARQMLVDISKEAHSDSFLKRSDLRPIVAAAH